MDSLENMEKFFKYDIEIKKIINKVVPKEEYKYNKETIMEYSD